MDEIQSFIKDVDIKIKEIQTNVDNTVKDITKEIDKHVENIKKINIFDPYSM